MEFCAGMVHLVSSLALKALACPTLGTTLGTSLARVRAVSFFKASMNEILQIVSASLIILSVTEVKVEDLVLPSISTRPRYFQIQYLVSEGRLP